MLRGAFKIANTGFYTGTTIIVLIFLFWIGSSSAADSADNSLSYNGTFIPRNTDKGYGSISDNGRYYCDYNVGSAGDETRELANFRLFDSGRLLYSMENPPGSDVYISNSGLAAFLDHRFHFKNRLTINFYSKTGEKLYSRDLNGGSLFGFSPDGNMFGAGNSKELFIISPLTGKTDLYEGGLKFDISRDGSIIAVASENIVKVYKKTGWTNEIQTGMIYPRRVLISADNSLALLVDKRNLRAYYIESGEPAFTDSLEGNYSFRDLRSDGDRILAGIHYRDDQYSRGILKSYDRKGGFISQVEKSSRYIESPPAPEIQGNLILDYDPIPWPFAPFDSLCTVWNHYEQHMSYGQPDWSYLHQGLDIITAVNQPTYAVQGGIVKCVLTIGGDSYWRMAVSPEQNPGWSSGWLYAHLVHSSIQFDVGDTVDIYDYLGNIIYWAENWGHIHFVEISDSGTVWQYYDNEWGINYNPLLSLQIDDDLIPPVFDDVFPGQKFAFSPNEIKMQYLDPDSLTGDIDIIAKIRDYCGYSEWQLPAYELYYHIISLASGDTILPRTLAQILNHTYDFYNSGGYETYAELLYRRDSLLVPSLWMDTVRNYYHILTNNNGDSLGELWEKQLSFHTADYPDGPYRIIVDASDAGGNTNRDSMDIYFSNGISNTFDTGRLPSDFSLDQNYPNPFNSATSISFLIDKDGPVALKLYDLRGRLVTVLAEEFKPAGRYTIGYSPADLSSGVYLLRLESGSRSDTKKIIFLK